MIRIDANLYKLNFRGSFIINIPIYPHMSAIYILPIIYILPS